MQNHIHPFLWMRGKPEETIRREMAAIDNCGIKAVCLESRPHPDFCGEGWWHDVDIIVDEAKKRDMKIWILDDAHFPTGYANGLIGEKYPERRKVFLNYNASDIVAKGGTLSLDVKKMLQPKISFLDIGKPIDFAEAARNSVVAVIAKRMAQGNEVGTETLDLTDSITDGWLHYDFPVGIWRVFTVFRTRLGGGRENYINMMDETSVSTLIEAIYEPHYEHYKDLFGTVIAGFFSDEPELGNIGGYDADNIIGRKEMPLPWCDAFPEEMERRFGSDWRAVLPLLWNGSSDKQAQSDARLGYMDIVTRRYQRCFGEQIGSWCRNHGVEHIGHVVEDNGVHTMLGCGDGHYFRAISGQDMSGIDVIRNQIMPGAGETDRLVLGVHDSAFYHYVLGRLGSSAADIDPRKKGRAMCELFGAYDWDFGVRDMSWILNHLLVRGINELVPHAFSMAEYPDVDCPPHFYAGGHNAQFPDFAELMRYGNRMCELLSGRIHKPDAGLIYQCEGEWLGERMKQSVPAKVLTQCQVDFDILPEDVFTDAERYSAGVENGTFRVNGIAYRTIFLPYMERMTGRLAEAVVQHPEITFVWIGGYPELVVGDAAGALLSEVKQHSSVIAPEEIAAYCRENRVSAIQMDGSAKELAYYHFIDRNGQDSYLFFNESLAETYRVKVTISGTGALELYDGWSDYCEEAKVRKSGDSQSFVLEIAPYELKCYVLKETADVPPKPDYYIAREIDLSENWSVSIVPAIEYPAFRPLAEMKELKPVSELQPDFSGIIRYEREFTLEEPAEVSSLHLEHVYECAHIFLDGEEVAYRIAPPYNFGITKRLSAGTHALAIEVSTTLKREQMKYPAPPFTLIFSVLEPTGMWGNIQLNILKER